MFVKNESNRSISSSNVGFRRNATNLSDSALNIVVSAMKKAKESSKKHKLRQSSARSIGVKNVIKAHRLSEATRIHNDKVDIGTHRCSTGYKYADYERLALVVFQKSEDSVPPQQHVELIQWRSRSIEMTSVATCFRGDNIRAIGLKHMFVKSLGFQKYQLPVS